MTKDQVKSLLEFANAHIEAPELFKSRKLATQEFLFRLENHISLISEILSIEEKNHKPVKFKLSYETNP